MMSKGRDKTLETTDEFAFSLCDLRALEANAAAITGCIWLFSSIALR
jgi:hypothetical protein